MDELVAAGAALLGTRAVGHRSLGGGLSRIARVQLADGRQVIVKDGPAPRMEARMLEAIAATGCPAPPVLAADDEVLVIGDLDADPPRETMRLGAAIARLHAARGPGYGWDHGDYAFGAVAIPNATAEDWPAFFAERRLLSEIAHLPGPLARRLETLAAGLAGRLPRHPPAALLHGDLWSGNVVGTARDFRGVVDPATYYGHAEVDIAMLALFGGGPSPEFSSDYGGLEAGAAERLAIYQLWPAIVHLRLFGDGYRSMVEDRLSALGV